jgi:hypothetical protein
MGEIMYEKKSRGFNAWYVVRYFEQCLNVAGNPIVFTKGSSEGKQLGHAKRLLTACKHSEAEVKAIIKEYCARDEGHWRKTKVANWWVENRPCLSAVVSKADEMRAKIASRQTVESKFRWEDLG